MTMAKLITRSLLVISAIMLFTFGLSAQKDATSLYAELDKNAAPNTLTKTEQTKGWVLLFNGTSNSGWHGYNMKVFPDCWTIENGSLTMTTEGMKESLDIVTNKKYRSFAFSVEYKLTKSANSGIIFQAAEDSKYKFPYETGPEMQVIDHDNWPEKLQDWQICGANYAMYPPIAKPYKPLGDWNRILLVVDGNNVTQMINGIVVVKYVKYSDEWTKLRNSGKWTNYPDWGKFDEGYITLQNHGTKVWYRNIKIKEL
jgi:hypothetical protein